MRNLPFGLVLCGLLSLTACDQYQLVDTKDAKTKLVDFKSCNCEIISKDELKMLREQAELGKHIHRFQMGNEGYSTWRFDTSTGKVCLLLAPEWDWKKQDVQAQNCAYETE